MLGILFSIAAAITNGLELVTHRYVMVRKADGLAYAFLWMGLASLVFLPFFVAEPGLEQELQVWAVVLASAVIWTVLTLFYFKAVSLLEVSTNIPVSKIRLLFVLFLSVMFFGESITTEKIAGTLLIFIGAVLATWKMEKTKSDPKGVPIAIITAFLISIAFLLDKYLVQFFTPGTLAFILFFLPSAFLFPFVLGKKKEMGSVLRKNLKPLLAAVVLASLTYFFVLNAFQTTEASIVLPLLELSILVSLFGAVVLLKERQNLKLRVAAIVIVLVGSILIGMSV